MLGRKVLHAVERRVGHAVEVLDRIDAELDEILRRHSFNRDMRGGAQILRLRLVHQRFELIAIHPEDLSARRRARALASRTSARDNRSRPALAAIDDPVDQHARRDNAVRLALGLPLLRLRRIAADLASSSVTPDAEIEIALSWIGCGMPAR